MLEPEPATVAALLPDLDGALRHAIIALEEWAIDLELAADDGADLGGLDADGVRTALADLYATASSAGPLRGRLLAAGGRHEYAPLLPAVLGAADVAVLQEALATARASRSDSELRGALETAADRWAEAHGAETTDADAPLERLAALMAVIGLDGADAALLRAEIQAAGPGSDTVLSTEGTAAYARHADRIARAWHGGDGAEERWAMG